MDHSKISITIPAYNEGPHISACVTTLLESFPGAEVIVVDDGSTDDTPVKLSAFSAIKCIRHPINKGYGASLRSAARAATREIIVWFDADGQHRVEDIAALVDPIQRDNFDAAIGSRTQESAMVVSRVPGKYLLRITSQIIARQVIPDLNCGFRAFKREVLLPYLHVLPHGFSASSTTTLLMLKRGYAVKFVPITTRKRTGKSSVRFIRDGARTFAALFRMALLFDAFVFFTALSLLQIIPGIAYSLYIAYSAGLGIPVLGALVILSGLITFFFGIISSQISEHRQGNFEFNQNR